MSLIENQHLEWKGAWRDENMKWIFGFVNTRKCVY